MKVLPEFPSPGPVNDDGHVWRHWHRPPLFTVARMKEEGTARYRDGGDLLCHASTEVAGFSRQVQHLMFSRNASAGVLYPRHFLGVELTAHVISSISRAV